MKPQKYCISAKNRQTGYTEDVTSPMSKEEADVWKPNSIIKKLYTYFRVSKHPFKRHKK